MSVFNAMFIVGGVEISVRGGARERVCLVFFYTKEPDIGRKNRKVAQLEEFQFPKVMVVGLKVSQEV
jgi:hypothetical protein